MQAAIIAIALQRTQPYYRLACCTMAACAAVRVRSAGPGGDRPCLIYMINLFGSNKLLPSRLTARVRSTLITY